MATDLQARNGNANSPAARLQSQIKTVSDLFEKAKPQIRAALPSHLTPERLTRIALTSIRMTPKLLDCDPTSLLKCVMQAAALGLEPDPILGRAYLIPYGREATLIIGYKGLIDLARRSGEILSIEAHVVKEADRFEYEFGVNEYVRHVPAFQEDRGQVTHAWAMARFKGGSHQFDVMDVFELERIRKGSKNGSGEVWTKHRDEMYRKTALRRLCKFLPLSPELSRHLAREEMFDAGVDAGEIVLDDGPAVDAPPPETRTDALAAKLGAAPREPGDDDEGDPDVDLPAHL